MTPWTPVEQFDAEKFKERYSLTDGDFQFTTINGQKYVRWSVDLPNPVIFDPPSPPKPVRPREFYASELAKSILASGTVSEQDKLRDTILRLIGLLPPEAA